MDQLKQKFAELTRAISRERRQILKSEKEVTDRLVKECLELIAHAYTHTHEVNEPTMSDEERDLLLMAHARHGFLRQGHVHCSTDESMKYLAGHMDGQRKTMSIMEDLSLALRQFKGAHSCTDTEGHTCPSHRNAENALVKFDQWKNAQQLPSTI